MMNSTAIYICILDSLVKEKYQFRNTKLNSGGSVGVLPNSQCGYMK